MSADSPTDGTDLRTLDHREIAALIPHRYPFLLVDKVVELDRGETAVGIKNVTINEPFFEGHFPGNPVMPGVLIIEALAQTAGVVAMDAELEEGQSSLIYFMTIQDARFRQPVVPGDQLRLHVTKERARRNVWRFCGEAKVGDQVVAEATFSAMFVTEE
jgi:3-hydroxyacyl-[acyl-carrier-protein] dehydratase